MTAPLRQQRAPEVGADGRAAETPNMFVRTLSVAKGLPWEQERMARLDAKGGAPLPLSEVMFKLKRLEPWRPGAAGRFAACYIRYRDVGARFEAAATVDGIPFTVEFVSEAVKARRLKRTALIASAAGLMILVGGAAIISALATRSDNQTRVQALRQSIDLKLRQARAQERVAADGKALTVAGVRGRAVDDFLVDLAWVSRSRDAAAHIDALRWERGYMAVESTGEIAPFDTPDRRTLRAEKPLRPGVWLWAVGPVAGARR